MLSFAKNMGTNIGENITEYLNNVVNNVKNLLFILRNQLQVLLKLFQTYDLIGNKIADKIKWSKSQNAPEFSSETDYESTEITKNIDNNRRDKTTNC